jgi:hypothetical protein
VQTRLSDILYLLSGRLSIVEFRAVNEHAFQEYRERSAERGSVVPIRIEEDTDFEVTRRHVAAACRLLTSGDLRAEELAYLANTLQLSDRATFASEDVAGYIAEFTDPEINGRFTMARAQEIIDSF